MHITVSAADLAALYTYPFPPEEGAIYDPRGLAHWLLATSTLTVKANDSDGTDFHRRSWVAMAVNEIVDRSVAIDRLGDCLADSREAVLTENRSAIDMFVESLTASPPIIELIPPIPTQPLVGWPIVVVVPIPSPPPVPPRWEDGEQLSAVDLIAAATRFETVAAAVRSESLVKDLQGAASRLLEVAQSRI